MVWAAAIMAAASMYAAQQNKKSAKKDRALVQAQLAEEQKNQALRRMFATAAADPNSPWFRNLAALEREAMNTESMRGLKQLFLEDRRLRARGVRGIVNPERRDESFASSMAEAFRQSELQSRTNARDALLQSAGRVGGNPMGALDLLARYGDTLRGIRKDQAGAIGSVGAAFARNRQSNNQQADRTYYGNANDWFA